MQSILPPQSPESNDPHDDNVDDDSLLRPVSTPPERDRDQAAYADTDLNNDLTSETMASANTSNAIPIVPLLIVAVVVIALLVYWQM